MRQFPDRYFIIGIIAFLSLMGAPNQTKAQVYPIDCAILLCLSAGWPASVPCARARAEFIRRITPWPVEPPLQIWRCPMGASFERRGYSDHADQIHDVLLKSDRRSLKQSTSNGMLRSDGHRQATLNRNDISSAELLPERRKLRLVQNRADIDISGPEFNFVRSIRVFDVRYAKQYESSRNEDCNRDAVVLLGTYGAQGDFSWQRSSLGDLPDKHVGLEFWGENCPRIYHRSVFVEWRDYEGNYGFEQVDY